MMRPGNMVMAVGGVTVGWYLSGHGSHGELFFRVACAAASLAYGNVINDLHDYRADCISHPQRPLVRGDISPRQGRFLAFLLGIYALGTAATISFGLFVATVVPLVLLTLYTLWAKATLLWGNILVSLLISYTLFYGSFGGQIEQVILPALLAGAANLIRELLKDFADEAGDRAVGVYTSALLSQDQRARLMRRLFWSTAVLFGIPLFILPAPLIYAVAVILGVFPLHYLWYYAFQRHEYAVAARWVKLLLVAGLSAFLLDLLYRVTI